MYICWRVEDFERKNLHCYLACELLIRKFCGGKDIYFLIPHGIQSRRNNRSIKNYKTKLNGMFLPRIAKTSIVFLFRYVGKSLFWSKMYFQVHNFFSVMIWECEKIAMNVIFILSFLVSNLVSFNNKIVVPFGSWIQWHKSVLIRSLFESKLLKYDNVEKFVQFNFSHIVEFLWLGGNIIILWVCFWII